MILKDLIKEIYVKPVPENFEGLRIEGIHCDSRDLQPNGLFVALPGFKVNGEDFIKDAIVQGAKVIVKKGAGRVVSNYTIPDSICIVDVEDPKLFLRQVTARFFNNPSKKVRTIGVTGTNGKTTITYFLESILAANQQSAAVIGTVNYRIAGKVYPSKNTTPGYLENQNNLDNLAASQIPYCIMEVSSHALEQGRVDGIDFVSAIFTNLTQDHLDYHKDMESYFKAKSILFENLSASSSAIINSDDSYGQRLLKISKGMVITYGVNNNADVKAVRVRSSLKGMELGIVFPIGAIWVQTRFIGEHNVYNILAAAACAYKEGIDLGRIRQGIEQLNCVPGRLEPVDGGQDFFVFIDYAHTEDGLVNVLKALRSVSRNKIILVFGCGGDRDKTKRPKMGKVACELADYSFVTNDNPRSEEPLAIIEGIKLGFTKSNFEIMLDRKEAIARALQSVKSGEIVLIAGKGHERYQIFKDRTIDFNEPQIVQELLQKA